MELNDRDGRPSPDALLLAARSEGRGRLKIFLGAAPGVGKTYEMLSAAQAKRREGGDVVVGVVETHGRRETETLLEGLEVIPRRNVEYSGRTLDEMDIDAVLKRHPQLVLVDELAHTNAPGSRHVKRYQDVEELLEAGIDVFSTLNIQHVESLNDVVASITRVRVRETVPDGIIDRADDIELIDLTPDDLIQRLKDGKVYVPQQAERAIRNYFLPGNLTALRELALRRTAQRVDAQMVDYMRSHAIEGPWAAGERVLVCVDGDAQALAVVRQARRIADGLRAPWIALHVETSVDLGRPEAERDRIAAALRLAGRLGAEVAVIPGQEIAETVVAHAREKNATQIVIARSRRSRWQELLRGSVARQVIRRAGRITVHVIAGQDSDERPAQKPMNGSDRGPKLAFGPYGLSLLVTGVGVGIGELLRRELAVSNIALVFLTGILVSAIQFGLWPALLACFASVLAYNFFFLPPLYTFTIADPENVVALFVFGLVAVIASNLAARTRAQAIVAGARARITEELYQFSRKLTVAVTLDDLLWATAHQIALMLKVRVVLLLPEDDALALRAGFPPEDSLDPADLAAARWCWANNRAAGRGADTLPGAKRLFLPMQTGRGPVGVIGIDRDEVNVGLARAPLLTAEQQRLLDALSDQAALAVERVTLAAEANRARLAAEASRLQSALLTSISHDLRTPLASILGSATSLRSGGDALDGATRAELLRTIQEEAERLNRFIGNLLDMTRVESGQVLAPTTLADLSDVVGAALRRAEQILANHRVEIDLPPDLPMLALDVVLFEQVLFNLLDNAAKYSPAASTIRIAARPVSGRGRGQTVRIEIVDEGDGIPEAELSRIFDKFFRAQGGDRRRAGTGLGLAVCRGFVEAMGGQIVAANRPDRRGAVFTITLPLPRAGVAEAAA